MKNLTVSFMLSVVAVFAARAVVLDKAYLAADRSAEGEATISRSEALVFRSGGDRIYGQILRPNAAFGKGASGRHLLPRVRRVYADGRRRGHRRLHQNHGRELIVG